MSLEPSSSVWIHGLLPLPHSSLSEASLLKLLENKPPTLDVSLAQFTSLTSAILSPSQSAAVMRLAFALTTPSAAMPADHAIRVPLGTLLLLLWVQWAHHELGESSATNVQRAQAASGEVWPSLLVPPAAAASAVLADGGAQPPSARTLAVQSRLSTTQLARRRRKLLQSSLPTLLQLAGAGAERLYAEELDRLKLVLRPDVSSCERLASRGQPVDSLSTALGLWQANPRAALPLHSLAPALRAALVEVVPSASLPSAAKEAKPAKALVALKPPPPLSLPSPPGVVSDSAPAAVRPTISLGDGEESERDQSVCSLTPNAEGVMNAPGHEVLRLQGAKKRTLVLKEADLRGGSLQLIDCHSCYIYALTCMHSVELIGCTHCTIVLGAVKSVTSASYCSHLKLYATTKALRLSNCQETTCYLCVSSPPLIWGENHRLFLAPYGTVYSGLATDMQKAKVQPQLKHNYWRMPTTFTSNDEAIAVTGSSASPSKEGLRMASPTRRESGGASGEKKWNVLPPTKYLPFHVPLDDNSMGGNGGNGVPPHCELPGEYAASLLGHVQRLALARDDLAGLNCSEEVRNELEATLHAGFKEWLVKTGNIRQLSDLAAVNVQ